MANPNNKNYSFFQNKECEFFPCHQTDDVENFNCLFCYCPLYALGKSCGGNYNYDNPACIKDCTNCILPHKRENYNRIVEKTKDLVDLTREEH